MLPSYFHVSAYAIMAEYNVNNMMWHTCAYHQLNFMRSNCISGFLCLSTITKLTAISTVRVLHTDLTVFIFIFLFISILVLIFIIIIVVIIVIVVVIIIIITVVVFIISVTGAVSSVLITADVVSYVICDVCKRVAVFKVSPSL